MIDNLFVRGINKTTEPAGLQWDRFAMSHAIQDVAREYDEFVHSIISSGDGTSPFFYCERIDHYRTLLARLDSLISGSLYQTFNSALASWAQTMDCKHASSPHVRVYPPYYDRELARDTLNNARFHYIIPLSGKTLAKLQLKIASESSKGRMRLNVLPMTMDSIVVHRIEDHYSIKPSVNGRSLLDYPALLDGYLW